MTSDRAQDPPFAVWRVFHDTPQRWFARGCPPTVRQPTRGGRILRATVLLGTLGLLSAWLCTAVDEVRDRLPRGIPGTVLLRRANRYGPTIPGVTFGLVVLVPLSRWVGRSWGPALASVLFSVLASRWAIWLFLYCHFPPDTRSLRLGEPIAGLMAGLLGGACLGLWMCDPRRRHTWTLVPAAAAIGTVAGFLFGVAREWDVMSLHPIVRSSEMFRLMRHSLPYALFQTSVAIALGARLWDASTDQDGEPCPAANTDATSTENPLNSTEVAVSPDLNSP